MGSMYKMMFVILFYIITLNRTKCLFPSLLIIQLLFMIQLNNQLSYYTSCKDVQGKVLFTLIQILNNIKSGIYRNLISYVRSQNSIEDYKKAKQNLPMFIASGIFSHRSDDINNLIQYSNIIILDFDHFTDEEDAIQFKNKLAYYSTPYHIYSIFISPSGMGVKAVMIHDNKNPNEHLRMFHQIKRDLFSKTPEFDMKCGNISRTCFVSDDPELFINLDPNLQPYHFVPDYSISLPSSSNRSQTKYIKGSTQKPFVHTSDQITIHNRFEAIERGGLSLKREADMSLMDYLTKKWNIQFPDAYVDGNRHKSILARAKTYCEVGILVENATNNIINTFGRHGISEQDIRDMVNYCYNTNEESWGNYRSFIYRLRQEGIQRRVQMLKNNNHKV